MDLLKFLLPYQPTLRNWRNADRFKPNVTPPRQKFAGFVEFHFNPSIISGLSDSSAFRTQISSLVQTAKIPEIQFQTQSKKSYNHRRLIQTGVDYGPCNLSVIDTVNNEWLTLFMKYFAYYYNEPRNRTESGNGNQRDNAPKQWDSNSEALVKSSAFGSTGFSSNTAGLDATKDSHFIETIRIINYAGGKGIEYILFRPQITSFDPGELDYTTSEFRTFDISFEIENMTVNSKFNFEMNDVDLARFESYGDFRFDNADSQNKEKVVRTTEQKDLTKSRTAQ